MRTLQTITAAALSLGWAASLAQFATTINDNHAVPAAPLGTLNVIPQNDGGKPTVNVTHYVLYPTVQVNCPSSGDLSAPVNAAIAAVLGNNGGIVDARRCQSASAWITAVTINQANTVLLLPCAQITATQALTIAAGTRNVTVRGCSFQGGSAASGTLGGTVWNYQAGGPAFIVGDSSYATDTAGFAMQDMAITLPNAATGATAIALYRTQEVNLERQYFIGDNSTDMTAIYLNGTGNYTGGTFTSNHISGFGTAVTLTGDSTGGTNAATFVRLHIDCPTSGGSPISGTIGVNLAYGDGNTFTGGDWESCSTMLSLGAGASDNSFFGVRNENSSTQISALSGSQYNIWITGGTMFTGKLTDAGTHNTFWDGFHRQLNNLNGDLWRSQADTTVTNHIQSGIGLGNVRGVQDEYITDVPGTPGSYRNAWLWGPGDGTTGLQDWVLEDLVNNTLRISVDESTTAGGNDQTNISGAGSGNVCVQCASNSGTGGLIIDSGGSSPTEVAGFDTSGDLALFGNLEWFVSSTLEWEWECASTSVCALRNAAATTPANVFRAFPNAGTEIDSQGTSAVVVNNTGTAGTGGFIVYEGGSNSSTAAFTVTGAGATSQASNHQVGTASGTGNVVLGNHLNQLATADFAGSCTMATATTCTVSFFHSWANVPACSVTPEFQPLYVYWYTWSSGIGSNVVVNSATATSGTYSVICVGNPN